MSNQPINWLYTPIELVDFFSQLNWFQIGLYAIFILSAESKNAEWLIQTISKNKNGKCNDNGTYKWRKARGIKHFHFTWYFRVANPIN
jgi:hypothetical protein